MFLYPRLPSSMAAGLIRSYRTMGVEDLREISNIKHPAMIFTPVGGARVSEIHLAKLQGQLFLIAGKLGWPEPLTSNAARNQFDNQVAVVLHRHMKIVPGEATRNDVWTFIACVVAPDLVRWRFPGSDKGSSSERFLGGVRSTFQRLWWRSHVFYLHNDPTPYRLLKELGEDELVQIMERPVLRGNCALAKMMASGLLEKRNNKSGQPSRMILMREVAKRLVRRSSITSLDALTEGELAAVVSSTFSEVVHRLSTQSNGASPS